MKPTQKDKALLTPPQGKSWSELHGHLQEQKFINQEICTNQPQPLHLQYKRRLSSKLVRCFCDMLDIFSVCQFLNKVVNTCPNKPRLQFTGLLWSEKYELGPNKRWKLEYSQMKAER